MKTIGALEAGGTKMVLGIYSEDGTEKDRLVLPTESPDITLPRMVQYFEANNVDALGIGSFGPLDLNPDSPTYGNITSTPKLAWKNTPLLKALKGKRNIPAQIDTDVNAAVLAEVELGCAKGCRSAVYITVGTGIGGGILINGELVHGLMHPELGHMLLNPLTTDTLPEGVCPYHKACLEGLASGTALGKRCIGKNAKELPDDDPLLLQEAHYLAQACHNLLLTLCPEKIILGGGVMQRTALLPLIRQECQHLLNGYLQIPQVISHMDKLIVSPALYPDSGLIGAYLLGKMALYR